MSETHVCPRCGKAAQDASAAFCAYCGTPMPHAQKPVSEAVQAVLDKVNAADNPKTKYALLTEAEKQFPDSLEIAQELLYLGRLHERGGKSIDFSVIKCYLLHMYLTPEKFKESQKQDMRRELFHHPQLERCQQLAPDGEQFTREYLTRLSAQFAGLFLRGSNTYMHSFFGIRMGGRAEKLLAEPAAYMLSCIRRDRALEEAERQMLYECFYRGYLNEIGGQDELDRRLNILGLSRP